MHIDNPRSQHVVVDDNPSSEDSESYKLLPRRTKQSSLHNNRLMRKKKYSIALRNNLKEEIKKENFSYRFICKKYDITYGTAYYLIKSLQKEFNESPSLMNSHLNIDENS